MPILEQPAWLLLLLPLGLLAWTRPLPTRTLTLLRLGLLLLVVLAMARPALRLPDRAGTVVVLADRSLSMPEGAGEDQAEMLELLQQSMSRRDRLAVVSFGRQARVERAPDVGPFGGFTQAIDPEGSNLAGALESALALLPRGAPGRILVLSDGQWTGRDPASLGARAAGAGVAIDYRHLARSRRRDVAIERFETPLRVNTGAAFMVHARVHSPVPQTLRYELFRDGRRIARGKRRFRAGTGQLSFRDRVEAPGVGRYRLHVHPPENDPVPENNTARALLRASGPRPVLLVTGHPDSGLAGLLEEAGLQVRARPAEAIDWSLATLEQHTAVVVENTPARAIGHAGLERLAAWIRDAGGGALFTGGREAFGPGGYFESPIDPLLPVSMELRQEHRKHALAVAVALDRSGSMGMPVGGGQTKMDLANLGAAKVLEMLSPMDAFGAVAVDTRPHTIVPFGPVPDDPGAARHRLLRTDSGGGGIYVGEALEAAGAMLERAVPSTRHIILFADARDAVKPGAYRRRIARFREQGITVSVIGLGTERDKDASLLQSIAHLGEGRVFFTQDARRLPQLFAQDMFVVSRSTFIDEPTPVRPTAGLFTLTGRTFEAPPPVGGYNLTYLREEATPAMVSVDRYEAPIAAAWQVGLGRTAVYTGEADGAFAGPIARWERIGDLLSSLTRWAIGEPGELPEHLLATGRLERGTYIVDLDLDLAMAPGGLRERPVLHLLHEGPGGRTRTSRHVMRWVDADRLRVSVPLADDRPVLARLQVPGAGRHALAPVQRSYAPEFALPEHDGAKTLAALARASGGRHRVDLAGTWGELPETPRYRPVAPWLLVAAACLLLLEVLERRAGTGALARRLAPRLALLRSRRFLRLPRRRGRQAATPAAPPAPSAAAGEEEGEREGKEEAMEGVRGSESPDEAASREATPPGSPSSAPEAPDLGDALDRARRAGTRRWRRKP